jgi:D-amino-acid dehydrogenase
MLQSDAPLLMNPAPTWHKLSWMAEFVAAMPRYKDNTIATARLAIASREHHFAWAKAEGIDFDHKPKGILHIYRDKKGFDHAGEVSKLLAQGGLPRRAVTPDEMKAIEPTLQGQYHGGYFTESDSTGDIHKFTFGLAKACERLGVKILTEHQVLNVASNGQTATVQVQHQGQTDTLSFDGIVVCAGVHGRGLAAQLGDRLNIYPVKGYSITVGLHDAASQAAAPQVSLLDDETKLVTSRLGADRFRVAGTAEFNGIDLDIRADRIKPLVNWVNQCFPGVDTRRVEPWAGLRPMMPNMLPRVGAGKKANVFYNTGHGHLGWTLSAITAHQLAGHVMAGMQDNVRSFMTPATA